MTKALPGDRWLKVLTASGCRVEVSTDPDTILSNDKVKALIGDKCDGVIGQLTEVGAAGRSRRRQLRSWPALDAALANSACFRPCSPQSWQHAAQCPDSPSHPCLPNTALAAAVPPAPAAQDWGAELFGALKAAGGRAYSNYAVGYNNVVVPEATKVGIPVGNTPGECGAGGWRQR